MICGLPALEVARIRVLSAFQTKSRLWARDWIMGCCVLTASKISGIAELPRYKRRFNRLFFANHASHLHLYFYHRVQGLFLMRAHQVLNGAKDWEELQ